ncbi:MAG: glycosyltransferase family 4 protein [Candidatus Pacebacteria bacterium]|nr:glycosyltransferase family 4 protein [Candidatus Paceibacterota bacterium]
MENIKNNLPVGILIHYHTTGGSFILAEKLSKKTNARLVCLYTGIKYSEIFLFVSTLKIFGKRVFVNPRSFKRINKKMSAWHIHYASPVVLPLFFVSRKPKILTYHYIFSDSPFLLLPHNFLSKIINILILIPLNILILNVFVFFVDKITFITNAQRIGFRENILFKESFDSKTVIISNFIENKIILKDKKVFNLNILFIGRYTELKGFNDLICVSKGLIDIPFSLIGDDKYISDMSHVNNIGVIENSEIFNYYDQHSIFILPSYTEVFPMTILEAMARGLVILVSDIPGMREIIKEGRNGYLFPPGDINKMREIILYLKNNPKEIERISKNNLEDIWKFTAEEQVPKYIQVYDEILK